MSESEVSKQNTPEMIDIFSLFEDMLNRLRSFWWVILLLTIGVAAFNYFRSTTYYYPSYRAEATVSVEISNAGSYSNENTAEQMGKVFPYILTSSALSEIIKADLNMSYVPGNISAKNIEGTNLLTISVTGSNPELTYRVLQSVLKNYPEVARYVVGQTEITVIDDIGVPTDTGKTQVVRGSVKKGLLIGFLIGVGLLVIYTLSTRTIRSEKDLTQMVNVNFLGVLPFTRAKRRKGSKQREINILLDQDQANYTEAMRLIRTRLERQMTNARVLIVTSSVPGEGKSTVAANLAISFAEKGRSVILVDCDLRNPSQKDIFRLTGTNPGLSAVVRGTASAEEALVKIESEKKKLNLQLIPGSDTVSNSVEVLDSERMEKLIDLLKTKADLVILDTPPSVMLADAMMLTSHADGVAYVVLNDYARRSVIRRGMEELSDSGTPIYGCILNGGHSSSGKYGYYGRYGYYGYKNSHYETEDTTDIEG